MTPENMLQQVETYQPDALAYLLNQNAFYKLANFKFDGFENKTAQLGTTVSWELFYRFEFKAGLKAQAQPTEQRKQTLTVTQSGNVSSGYNETDFTFNVKEYMDKIGNSRMQELANNIEEDAWKNIDGTVRQMSTDIDGNVTYGAYLPNSGPYRFYGDGQTPLNSFAQLMQGVAEFKNVGAAKTDMVCIMPTTVIPSIIQTGLKEFALKRNDDLAMSWELGSYGGVTFYESNLLPVHISGDIGDTAPDDDNVITVTGVDDESGQDVRIIYGTWTTGGSATKAVRVGDVGYIELTDNYSANTYALTYIGHKRTLNRVQFVITEDAPAVAGAVELHIRTITNFGLGWAGGANRNISAAIVPGMTIRMMPTHQCGLIMSAKALYGAIPKLRDLDPFRTARIQDPDTGISLRTYFGNSLGGNSSLYVDDAMWGTTLVPERCQRYLLPLSQMATNV